MEVHSRGHMEPIENRRLEATSDDETSANAEFSGIEKEGHPTPKQTCVS
jgi:hypothetical protein